MFTINRFELTPLKIPLIKPLLQKNGAIQALTVMVLDIYTAEGITAQSFIYGINDKNCSAIMMFIEQELMPSIVGNKFDNPAQVWNELWLPRREKISAGLCLYALALIDIACWDIAAKLAQTSLAQLLGNKEKCAPIYGAGGWLALSEKALYEEARSFLEKGISLYKIKVGSIHDESRIAFLQREFGTQLKIAVDANQQFALEQAIEKSSLFEKYGIEWFEDPLYSDSIYELKKLAENSNTPLCIGENFGLHWRFKDVCEMNATDYIQADVVRCGGITPFLKIVEVTKRFQKPFLTHLMTELSASLLMLSTTGLACEFLELFPPETFTHPFNIQHGRIFLPNTHGTGVYFNNEVIKKYKII